MTGTEMTKKKINQIWGGGDENSDHVIYCPIRSFSQDKCNAGQDAEKTGISWNYPTQTGPMIILVKKEDADVLRRV